MTKHILFILSFFLLSFPSKAMESDSEEEDGLKKTVSRDLRSSPMLPSYTRGEFPSQESLLARIQHTDFCAEVKEVAQAQKLILKTGNPPLLNVRVCEDGRCMVSPELMLLDQERVLMQVEGKDGRSRVTETNKLPYRVHGHMIMKFSNGKEYVGSGTLIGPHHVLTAGHNIYSHKIGEGWATSVNFIPGQNEDERPFGDAQGAILLSVNNWIKDQNKEYDFGMVILDESIGYRTGWAGIFAAPDELLKQNIVHVSGYPGDKGEKDKQSTQMWTMGHKVKTVFKDKITYDIDTYPGQSGSGVWTEWGGYKGYHIVGIHAYGEERNGEGNAATRISPIKFKRLVSWMQEYQLKDFMHPSLPSSEEKKAKALYVTHKEGAKRNEAESQYQLGLCYEEGKGVGKDAKKAFKWYKKAAKQGHRLAQCQLALCYKDGSGTEENITQALSLFFKLADENDAWAQNWIGVLYHNGQGVPQDYAKAMEWYMKAATQNDARAQYNIGLLYHYGRGVPQDYAKAMEWYMKAATQNHASAKNSIGILYDCGLGVPKDYAKAMEWYMKAANQNDASAQYNIGALYHYGQGVPKDYEKAKEWYRKAAAQGNKTAEEKLKKLNGVV